MNGPSDVAYTVPAAAGERSENRWAITTTSRMVMANATAFGSRTASSVRPKVAIDIAIAQ